MAWSLLAALTLTLALVAGIGGLGRLAGLRGLPEAWVVGFHMTWWPAALVGTVAGPEAGAAVALAVPAVGLLGWVRGGRRGPLGILLVATVAGAPVWLAPPVFYDSLVYHLGMPWSWLVNGSMAPVPHNLFSNFPLAASAVYLGPVRLGLPSVAAGLHWAAMTLAAMAAVSLAGRLGAGRWAWLAALCTVSVWHGLWVGGLAAADWFVVLGVTVVASEIAGELGTGAPGRPWMAGLGLGLALAAKYTAAVPAAAVLAALVAVRPRAVRWAGATGGIAVAAGSFWFVRNLLITGNPVYPLAWNLIGGRGWDAATNSRYLAAMRAGAGGPVAVLRGLARLPGLDRGLGPWVWVAFALMVATALSVRRQKPTVVWAAGAVGLGAVGWAATAQLPRFALPLVPILGAGAAASLASVRRPVIRGAVAVALFLGCLAGAARWAGFTFGTAGWAAWWHDADGWRHAVTVDDPMPAYRAAARLLPGDARILLVGEARSFGCPRPYHASSARDVQLVQAVVESAGTARDAARVLGRAGFTHLLIAWGEIRRLHAPPASVLRWRNPEAEARWWAFLERWTTPVWQGEAVEIRSLGNPGGNGRVVPVSGEPGTMRAGEGQGGDHHDREDP